MKKYLEISKTSDSQIIEKKRRKGLKLRMKQGEIERLLLKD